MRWTDIEARIPPDFQSDGCTAWPDRYYVLSFANRSRWRRACRVHDWLYSVSGRLPGRNRRLRADWILKQAVTDLGAPVMAWVMFVGVRCFGWYAWRQHERAR